MKKLIAVFILLGSLVACTSVNNTSKIGKPQVSIVSTKWVLADAVKGKSPVLIIQKDRVSGNAGCNDYSAELQLRPSDGSFSVKNISGTRMVCSNSSVEQNFLSMLSMANKYVVIDNTLEFYKDGLLLMKLNKQ